MNKAFVGDPFDLSERYAQVLMVVFVTLLYSGGMPLLLPLCALSLWVHYGVDKVSKRVAVVDCNYPSMSMEL